MKLLSPNHCFVRLMFSHPVLGMLQVDLFQRLQSSMEDVQKEKKILWEGMELQVSECILVGKEFYAVVLKDPVTKEVSETYNSSVEGLASAIERDLGHPIDLDDLVITLKADEGSENEEQIKNRMNEASLINNGGITGQVQYICECLGEKAGEQEIRNILRYGPKCVVCGNHVNPSRMVITDGSVVCLECSMPPVCHDWGIVPIQGATETKWPSGHQLTESDQKNV